MRKQYHVRASPKGRLIWDVHRLVKLTEGLPIQDVPLRQIRELDEPYWYEDAPPTCRDVAEHARLIAQTDLRYPIILSADGRVMDGMHRVAKAYLEGQVAIRAVRFLHTPAPDYIDVDLDSLSYDE